MKIVTDSITDTVDTSSMAEGSQPHTIVLQPTGCLDSSSSSSFRVQLEQALQAATNSVIVDLMRIEKVHQEGISVLAAGLRLATALEKGLSICSISASTRLVLQAEYNRQWEAGLGHWSDQFQEEFEFFLRHNPIIRKRVLQAQQDRDSDQGPPTIVQKRKNYTGGSVGRHAHQSA